MTMKRTTKAAVKMDLAIAKRNGGYVPTEWQKPSERRSRQTSRGHAMMTVAEFLAHRLGRGQKTTDGIDAVIAERGKVRRTQRIVGGKRVTRAADHNGHGVDRKIRRAF